MEVVLMAAAIGEGAVILALLLRLRGLARRARRSALAPAAKPTIVPRMAALAHLAERRRPRQPDAEHVLPPLDIDLDGAFRDRMPETARRGDPRRRRDFADHAENLRRRLAGHRRIEFFNALAISYLRRRTPHTDHARALFHRIWDEQGAALVDEVSSRWLISTLMTYADHGRDEAERLCGALGYLYGAMIVAAETERSYWRDPPPEIAAARPDRERFALFGSSPFELGTSDHLANLNAFVYERALVSPTAGPLLEKLIMRVRYNDCLFSRFDSARRRLALNTTGEEAERFWAFGAPAKPDGSQA